MDAVITTFEMILADCPELREIEWRCVVIDEAHRLKNRNCKLLEGLKQLKLVGYEVTVRFCPSCQFESICCNRRTKTSPEIIRCYSCLFCSITSTTEGEGGYVFTPYCLFVCLCAGYLKKLWTDPDEILWTDWVCDLDELIRFW